jgi:TolA-binding protein
MDNIREGVKDLNKSVKDNYALVLPVYNYGDQASATKMNQYADIAIKKASKTINKHSMVFNRREYVRWIDDAYMLIGKAYFYKQDYPMARRTFEFVIKTYNYDEIKYEAMLWVARSNSQDGQFDKAESMLDMLLGKLVKGEVPSKYELPINLEYAQMHILKKTYDAAIMYLERALELHPPSLMATRCRFILGQIHQSNGELDDASKYYVKVIKRAREYEMEFNAKINLAQCYNAKTGDREFILSKLNKMLKDDKNTEFRDQIYYALANIAMKDGDTALGIEYFKTSVASSTKNNYQKAISSLSLADLYFERKEYTDAQYYYDSTMLFIPMDFSNYKELAKKTTTLTELVKNLQVIQKQDSLQRLAAMPEDKLNKIIDKIIQNLIAEERKKQMEEQQRAMGQYLYGQNANQEQAAMGGSKEGKWYFYNPTLMSTGFTTFRRKWGQRRLEDNWFLGDKTLAAFSEETKNEEDTTGMASDSTKAGKKGLAKSKNPKERAYYLPDIPTTKEMIQASNDMIVEAYYQAGFIFVEGLGDYGNAVLTFEKLLERFPDNKYKMQSAYELCILYRQLQNDPQSDYYKNQILTLYPTSDYAKLLVNPEYYKELGARKSEASRLYDDTYRAFTNQQYYMVINNGDMARSKFSTDTNLIPRFEYLRALALGKIEVVDSLVNSMKKIIATYPKSDVKPLAEDVLAFLGPTGTGVSVEENQEKGSDSIRTAPAVVPADLYTFDSKAVHFYVLIVNDNLVDVDALKIKLSDYNSKYHDLENLNVNSLVLDEGRQMITVSSFNNSQTAMIYIMGIRDSKYIFTRLQNAGEYHDFVISVENYPIFYRNKDAAQYVRFFEKNYPIKK